VVYLYSNNEQTEKEYRKIIPLNQPQKRKYLRINLKDVKELYRENYKPLKKEIKGNYRRWKISHAHGLVSSNCENVYITKSNLHVQLSFHQISNEIHYKD
jgi:hypothetical protein